MHDFRVLLADGIRSDQRDSGRFRRFRPIYDKEELPLDDETPQHQTQTHQKQIQEEQHGIKISPTNNLKINLVVSFEKS